MNTIPSFGSGLPQYGGPRVTKPQDPVIQGLRDAMGMELIADNTYVDTNGERRSYTAVRSKGGKEALFESAQEAQEKLAEMNEKRHKERVAAEEKAGNEATSVSERIAIAVKDAREEAAQENGTISESEAGADNRFDITA